VLAARSRQEQVAVRAKWPKWVAAEAAASKAVGCRFALGRLHDACVLMSEVDGPPLGIELFTECFDARQRRQVELLMVSSALGTVARICSIALRPGSRLRLP